ncbi:MAG: M14 family zinc carboxypeptidase [Myxococcota bacterium]|nr:M14 family zinc carboxypeptidase [Myxococcota bacterium]
MCTLDVAFGRCILILLSCCVLAAPVLADDSAVQDAPKIIPPYNDKIEINLFDPVSKPWRRIQRGKWAMTEGGLRPAKEGHYLIGRMTDGQVRMQFSKRTRNIAFRLLFRSRMQADNKTVSSGYAVRVSGRYIWLEGIKNGRFRPLSRGMKMRRAFAHPYQELVLTLMGDTVMVQVYNLKTGARSGELYAVKIRKRSGEFGFLVDRTAPNPTRFGMLTYRPLCNEIERPHPGHSVFAEVTRPVPNPWPKQVTILKAPKKDESCKSAACGLHTKPFVIRTDPLGIEQMHCTGLRFTKFISRPPWMYVDDSYRARMAREYDALPDTFPVGRIYNASQINQMLHLWAQKYRDKAQLLTLGESHEGRPILGLAIGDRGSEQEDKPAFLINSGHHGNEPMSVLFLLDLINELLTNTSDKYARILKNTIVLAVPLVNPDGFERHLHVSQAMGRKNGRATHKKKGRFSGVDLNRNYPARWGVFGERGSSSRRSSAYYRGSKVASEPETQAMMKLAATYPFVGSISYHTGTIAILSPYTIEKLKNPKLDEAWGVASELAKTLGRHPQKINFRVKRNLYPVDGVDQDWHRYKYGTLALLVEGAIGPPVTRQKRAEIIEYMRPSWHDLITRFLDGPSLSIRTLDKDRYPVSIPLQIVGMQPPNDEVWTSRCPGGFYRRYLPSAGQYQISFDLLGDTYTETVSVKNGRQHVDLVLPFSLPQKRCGSVPVGPE